jgi:hypothetical protein
MWSSNKIFCLNGVFIFDGFLAHSLLWFGFRQSWDQNTVPREPEANKENIQQHDVEWQALNLLVGEANSTQCDRIELRVEEVGSQEHSDSVILLEKAQSPTVGEAKLVPKIVFLAMSDNKQQQPQQQQQPQPQQPQQQTAALLDQNVQQVQVQVSTPSGYGV